MGLVRPTVTVLIGPIRWWSEPPPPTTASAVFCVPCGGQTWTAANRWHGLGNTNISGLLSTVAVRAPVAMTITDIRVELTGALGGGGGSTIGWGLDVNGTPDTTLVASVVTGNTGAVASGSLSIAEGDQIAIVTTRTGTPSASVTTRGLTIGYQVALA